MKINCRGHTLIELLVSMTLSMLIIAALIPLNSLSIRTIQHVQKIEARANRLNQSVQLLEADLKATGLTGCAAEKTLIHDAVFKPSKSVNYNISLPFISGYSNGKWFPDTPHFISKYDNTNDGVNLKFTDLPEISSADEIVRTPERILLETNCLFSTIIHARDSILNNASASFTQIYSYAFQSIQYYIKRSQGKLTLYRQYLTKSGHPRNEPLVDNIVRMQIGYGEKTADDRLEFRPASTVEKWTNIIAVYVSVTIPESANLPISILVLLRNHASAG